MSDLDAKTIRAARAEKAKRMAKGDPQTKTDASSWTPDEMLNAEAKTGMRPISPRAFKRGGSVADVDGSKTKHRVDRMPRKAGGVAEEYMNRDQKEANEARPGVKHVGGLKKGGRAGHAFGGKPKMNSAEARRRFDLMYDRDDRARQSKEEVELRTPEGDAKRQASNAAMLSKLAQQRKAGGRAGKDGGGPVDPRVAAMARIAESAGRAGVPAGMLGFQNAKSAMAKAAGLKAGGRTKRADGGSTDQSDTFPPERGDDRKPLPRRPDYDSGATSKPRPVIDLSDKLGKYAKGGRSARASGGRTKSGKTNVNIIIATGGKGQQMPEGMPPMPMPPPGGVPVAVSPPPGGGGAPPPMPIMVGGGAPMAGPPPGAPPMPMPRKAGGRTYRSYKDMDAGAMGGMGRLEKAEIQKHKR